MSEHIVPSNMLFVAPMPTQVKYELRINMQIEHIQLKSNIMPQLALPIPTSKTEALTIPTRRAGRNLNTNLFTRPSSRI